MRRYSLAAAAVTLSACLAVGLEKPRAGVPVLAPPADPAPPYTAPKADGPVAVLIDEQADSLFPLLTNTGGGEPGTVVREDRDVFAGVEAVRVGPLQKYQPHIPGWAFKVVETPKNPGEFRHLRFAWKKLGGSGVMLQLHDSVKQGWGLRYHAGQNSVGWESKGVREKPPAVWEVVTRDLFKDFGETALSGIAFTAMDGEAALFDLVLLGRTVEDLDRATDEALGRVKPARPLAGAERNALWADLIGPDRKKAGVAIRAFLESAPEQVGYVRDRLPRPDPGTAARVRKLVAELTADDFDARLAATDELVKLGPPALPAVRDAAGSSDPEVRYRAGQVLKRLGGADGGFVPAARVVRVLERAANPAARDLLKRLAEGECGDEYSADAKAALARLAGATSPR